MKKKIFLICLLLLFLIRVGAQVTVSSNVDRNLKKFDLETFKNFKSTTTIFVLSDVYHKDQYDKILKEYWTVTPYKIVSRYDFKLDDYLEGTYSFALLRAYCRDVGRVFESFNDITFFFYDYEKNKTKIEKLKIANKPYSDLIYSTRINIGAIHFFVNTEFIQKINNKFKDGRVEYFYSGISSNFGSFSTARRDTLKNSKYENDRIKEVFNSRIYKNYTLGYLKNYFQKINNLISNEEFMGMQEPISTDELKNLALQTLFIPEYNKTTYKPVKIEDEQKSEKEISNLFEDYIYKFEFISEKDLDEKIFSEKNFYYLRYVKINNQKFFEVVNGKTGEIIYKEHEEGFFTFNIQGSDFKKLAKKIKSKI